MARARPFIKNWWVFVFFFNKTYGVNMFIICSGPLVDSATVLPAKNDSGVMLCLHSYQGLRINRSLVD